MITMDFSIGEWSRQVHYNMIVPAEASVMPTEKHMFP